MLMALILAMAGPQCAPANAQPTTVEQIAREPAAWFDKCVRLDGYVSGNAFYSGPAGRYRRFASDRKDRPNEGWLGLYFNQAAELHRPLGKATVVGRVSDCVKDYEAAEGASEPGELVMPLGYCHFHDGLILQQVEVLSRVEAEFERQKGEQNRKSFGDLLTQAEASTPPPDVVGLINRFRLASQAHDLPGMRQLIEPWNFTIEQPQQAREFDAMLMGRRPPLQDSPNTFRAEPVYFKAKTPKNDPNAIPADWFACFCRIANCDGEWPIADSDTGANASLPYICLRIYHKEFKPWGRLTLGYAKG